jgi:sterol desaturase/sphingolipid hydroxylase (fatty acid hydroxylase superfamily)
MRFRRCYNPPQVRQSPIGYTDWLMTAAADVVLFTLGLFTWTFVEYVIHGFMGHIYRTFVTPLHAAHHRDPHAVFTVGAWMPLALITLILLWAFGFAPATVFWLGIMAGFVTYEIEHYRIHFAQPSCAYEARLRLHHLAHHRAAPNACFGVTSRLWDRIFGSEPEPARMTAMENSVAGTKQLTGPTNARLALRPWVFLQGPPS